MKPKGIDFQMAKIVWLSRYPLAKHDDSVKPYISEQIISGEKSWLKMARTALQLSLGDVADKLGIERSTLLRQERSEEQGKISLNKIREIANAMDCELVYAIRPVTKEVFSELIWNKLLAEALPIVKKKLELQRAPSHLWGNYLGYYILDKMSDPKFRRKMGWTKKQI